MFKAIIGAGGFGKEVYWSLSAIERKKAIFFVDDVYWDNSNKNILPLSSFDPEIYEVVVAVGDSHQRERIVKSLPKNTRFFTHIHPSVEFIGENISIGRGSVICAGSIISCNTSLGEFSMINFNCTLGHDSKIGDYFTAAPGVNISGNVSIGDKVYCGTQAAIKQGITIANEVVIGMSSALIRDVLEEGVTVFGNPARVIIKSKNQ